MLITECADIFEKTKQRQLDRRLASGECYWPKLAVCASSWAILLTIMLPTIYKLVIHRQF